MALARKQPAETFLRLVYVTLKFRLESLNRLRSRVRLKREKHRDTARDSR